MHIWKTVRSTGPVPTLSWALIPTQRWCRLALWICLYRDALSSSLPLPAVTPPEQGSSLPIHDDDAHRRLLIARLYPCIKHEAASVTMDVILNAAGDKPPAGSGVDDASVAPGPSIPFPLLMLITQARNEHGMRQQDVRRYRHYCSTKVHRLREVLHKTHTPDSNKRGGSHGNKKGGAAGGASKRASKKVKRKAQSATVQSQTNKGKGNVFTRRSIALDEVQNDRCVSLRDV